MSIGMAREPQHVPIRHDCASSGDSRANNRWLAND